MDSARATKEQKSAVVLSIWHCILSMFFMKPGNMHHDAMSFRAMANIYQKMKHVRDAIEKKANPNFSEGVIRSVCQDITFITDKLPNERWHDEVVSMMRELVTMERMLNQEKKRIMRSNARYFVVEYHQGKELACVLTLWYWLGSWSSLEGRAQHAKELFLQSIEMHPNLVANLLFTHSMPSKSDRDVLHDLMSKLHFMVATDTDHWLDVLQYMTETMADAGVKLSKTDQTTTDSSGDMPTEVHVGAPNNNATTIMLPTTSFVSMSSVAKGTKRLLKNVAIQIAIDQLLNALPEIGKPLLKGVNEAGHTIEEAWPAIKAGTELAYEVAKELAHQAVEHVHEEVEHLVHKMREGFKKIANAVKEDVGEVGHFFKHLFHF